MNIQSSVALPATATSHAHTDPEQGDQHVELKQKWLDSPMWDRLYEATGLRKPAYWMPCTRKYMDRYLDRAGISHAQYRKITKFKTYEKYAEKNPTVPLWAFIGMMLEATATTPTVGE